MGPATGKDRAGKQGTKDNSLKKDVCEDEHDCAEEEKSMMDGDKSQNL